MLKVNSKVNNKKVLLVLGLVLIFIGLAGIAPTLYFRLSGNSTVSANPSNVVNLSDSNHGKLPLSHSGLVDGYPVYISIPGSRASLNINAPIIPGYYTKSSGTWTLTETTAQFATTTTEPNNITGNTFIYGHYIPAVFAYLHLIKPGTIATITTSNGYYFEYSFSHTYAVSPRDTVVLNPSYSPILTIQTCSGDFFQNRQIYIFNFVKYIKK